MKGDIKIEKDLSRLGLPPMTLAEPKENDQRRRDVVVYNIVRKICIFLLLLVFFAGGLIFMTRLLENYGGFRTTEIFFITSLSKNANVTVVPEGIEISFHLKNNSDPILKRKKRSIPEDTTDTDRIIPNINDEEYQKARDIILNHNVLCNSENENEICKDLVKKLKTITDGELNASTDKKKIKDTTKASDNEQQKHSRARNIPIDMAKRETFSFPTEELTGFSSRDAFGYGVEPYQHTPPYSSPYSHQHHLPDTCMLARLLNHGHSQHSGGYPIPEYGPSAAYPHSALPIPGISSKLYRETEDRDVEPRHREIHPQDAEIFRKFLAQYTNADNMPKPAQNSTEVRDAQCPEGSVPCFNGECIPENQWCNGHVDCADVSDEAKCGCKTRVDKSRLCDGYFDCPFGEDEMGCYGCDETSFSCEDLDINSKTSCFSKEQRCNNIMECPNNRDEIDCNMLSPSLHNNPLFAISNTEGFLQRNFKGDWYAVCKNPYMWAHDACRRETGLIIRPPFIQILPVDPLLRLNYLNTGPEGLLQTSNTCFNSSAIYVTCPELLCGTRILTTSQLIKENSAIENHLFGRNKRFLLNGRPYPVSFYDPIKRTPRHNPVIGGQFSNIKIGNKVSNKKKRAQSRVVGGRPSKPAAWPWMAALYRNGMFHCGGVVVNQHWVLSAAHCVHEFWNHYFEVQVGMLRRFSFSPQDQNHLITHIIVNQKYDQADMKNDLSLLRVKSSIQFSRWVRPICLPGPNTAGPEWLWGPPPGTSCTAVGWGATVEHGPDPDHMREVELPIWAKCKHSEDQEGKEICAGPVEGGKDACQGDSGGPLLCRSPLNSQQWYLAGIVSHGDGCARKGEPGVYTRVSLFVKWIRHHIGSKVLPTIQPLLKCPGFQCTSGISKCLPQKRVCDKIVDCLDGEDEKNCNTMRSLESLLLSRTSKDNENISEKDLTTADSHTNTVVTHNSTKTKSDLHQPIENSSVDYSRNVFKPKNNGALKSENDDSVADFLHASTIEISIPKSAEFIKNENSEQSLDNPTTSIDRETEFFETLTISSPRPPLESRSSLLENENLNLQPRASDIQEDWVTSTTQSETSTIVPDLKTNSPTVDTTSSMSVTSPISSETSTTESTFELTTTAIHTDSSQNNNNNREDQESKSLLVELLPHTQKLEDANEKSTNTSSLLENKEISTSDRILDNFSSKKISNFDDKLDIIHKIEDIVLSELQPAKIRKKHLTPKEFECRRIPQTIPYKHRCNHEANCEDGTDELSCTCADYLFTFDKTLLCDGIFDCADGQDEADCFSCSEDRYLCRKSQICLPMKHVCDGKPHCPQGEDEIDCLALSNGRELKYDIDERPKTLLEGYLTKKQNNQWHVICEDNLSTEEQEQHAAHICHYLGFSSANRYLLKHLNIDDGILKSSEDRKRRETKTSAAVHFTYREVSSSEDNARHIVIKEPQVLKEHCIPNVKKTCMSLYVYCDHGLFTDFNLSPNLIYSRSAETVTNEMWPWVAKVFVEGDYRCTGVLVDPSFVLVSHSCLWDSSLSRHMVTVVLGSHRTLNSTQGPHEQILQVDGKRDLYRSNVALLHLKEQAQFSTMVRPMTIQSSISPESKNAICLAVGQDGKNQTLSVFVDETRENCPYHNKCFKLQSKTKNLCLPGMVSSQQWAGIISCHTEQGWYPSATFVDIRGECGLQGQIVGTGIENLKLEIRNAGNDGNFEMKKNLTDNCNGVRCGRGKCISWRQVCNGVRNCEDGKDESEDACETKQEFCKKDPHDKNCECATGQFRCHNGVCIAKEQFNDGNDDCGDGTDEPEQSTCSKYLARVMPSRLCDGVLHCKDRSDEDPMFCKCFAKRTHPCGKTGDEDHCVAPDVVCDGVNDCPNGEDESACIGLSAPQGTEYGKGQVMVRSHGVWHTKCYANKKRSKSELEAICRELGFISGHAKELEISDTFKPHPYNSVLLDPFSDVWLNNRTQIKLRNTHTPLARAIFDDQLNNCHPVFIECL